MKRSIAFLFSLALALPLLASSYAQGACGTVEVSKGDIKIFSAQTKQLAPAPAGSKICSGDTIVAGADSRAKLKMEDGNELNISPDSKIVLENYQFSAAQNKKKVLLNVLQGKVRATTQRENMYNDKSSNGDTNTFQVRTKSAVAGVRGTDFLTGYDAKTGKSDVVTFRGKVEFGQPGPGGAIRNAVQVGAGQKTEVAAGQPPAPPHSVPAKELDKANHESKSEASSAKGSGSSSSEAKNDGKGGKDKGGSSDKSADKGGSSSTASSGNGTAGSGSAGGPASSANSDSSSGSASGGNSGSSSANSGSANGGTASTGPMNSSGGPAPASISVGPASSSMVDMRDMNATAPTTSGPGGPLVTPAMQVPITVNKPTVVLPPAVPTCDFCNSVISTGPTKVNIKINLPH